MSNEQVVYIPVKAGFEMACEGETTWKLYTSEGDIGVVDSADRKNEHYLYARPHGLYLCQETTVPAAASVPREVHSVLMAALRNLRNDIAFRPDVVSPRIKAHMSDAFAWLSTVTQEGDNDGK